MANKTNRYMGKGVLQAVASVNGEIARRWWASTRPSRRPSTPRSASLTGPTTRAGWGQRDPRRVLAVAKSAASFTLQPLYRYVGGTAAHVLPVR